MQEAVNSLRDAYNKYNWKVVSPTWTATKLGRPYTLFPKIHMTEEADLNTSMEWCCNELVHEITHIYQQKSRWNLPFWLVKYFGSKTFRAQMEVEAFGAEYKRALWKGFTIDWAKVKKSLMEGYYGAFTEELADTFIESLKQETFDTIDWETVCKEAHERKKRSDGR